MLIIFLTEVKTTLFCGRDCKTDCIEALSNVIYCNLYLSLYPCIKFISISKLDLHRSPTYKTFPKILDVVIKYYSFLKLTE